MLCPLMTNPTLDVSTSELITAALIFQFGNKHYLFHFKSFICLPELFTLFVQQHSLAYQLISRTKYTTNTKTPQAHLSISSYSKTSTLLLCKQEHVFFLENYENKSFISNFLKLTHAPLSVQCTWRTLSTYYRTLFPVSDFLIPMPVSCLCVFLYLWYSICASPDPLLALWFWYCLPIWIFCLCVFHYCK